jgi:flagellar protein FlbD
MAVNPDLIERAEATPDTVLTMTAGHKLIVTESLDEVVELVRTWRASIAAQAWSFSRPETVAPPEHDELTDHAAIEATLARVLRLPPRGE